MLLLLCWNILRIGMRFIVVTLLWRAILRRIWRATIPHRITRRGAEGDAGGGGGGGGGKGGGGRCRSWATTCRMIALLVAAAAVVVAFAGFYVSPYLPRRRPSSFLSLPTMVSTLCAIGTMVASVLNGFGCASMPHANLVGALLEPTPPGVMAKVQEDLDYAIEALEEKRWLLADVSTQQQQHHHQPSPTSLSSSFASMSSSSTPVLTNTTTTNSDIRKAKKQLEEEVVFLANLVGDMEDDVREMRSSSLMALEARTTVGRIRSLLGAVFSIVLVVRVLFAASTFLSGPVVDHIRRDGGDPPSSSSSRRDPLTSILLLLVGRNYIVGAEQYARFSQMTSLVLAGALTASQVSSFFRVVGALGRRFRGTFAGYYRATSSSPRMMAGGGIRGGGGTGRRRVVVNDAAVLASSFVMGCYFLACVTVVKMNLPVEYRRSFSAAVGGSNFGYYIDDRDNARLMNVIFLASACVSAITLASLFGIQRNNSDRYRIECSRLLGSSTSSLHSLA